MFGFGHWEILIIVLVLVLIFGARRIPEMARGVGKGIIEFKKALGEGRKEETPKESPEDQAAKEEEKDGE